MPELVEAAADACPSMRLVIKPHPAETPTSTLPAVPARPNIVGRAADGRTWRACWRPRLALVTMNSTVAIDGLVLGVPALVVGLPNNLSPFVEAGVMAGRRRRRRDRARRSRRSCMIESCARPA